MHTNCVEIDGYEYGKLMEWKGCGNMDAEIYKWD